MPESNVFDLDVSNVPLKVAIIDRELKKINASLKDITNITRTYNAVSKEMVLALEGVTKRGAAFKTTFIESKKAVEVLTSSIKKQIGVLSDLQKKQGQTAQLVSLRQDVEKEVEEEGKIRSRKLRENLQEQAALKKKNRDIELSFEKIAANAAGRAYAEGEQKKEDAAKKRIKDVAAFDKQLAKDTSAKLVAEEKKKQQTISNITKAVTKQRAAFVLAQARAADGFKKTGEAGKKAGDTILISWRSVVRLFGVQVLHAAFANLRRLMAGAVSDALEFSKRVAEIRTITDDAAETTRDWSQSLRELGQDLPFTQLQIAESAYQALSNQVISTTRDLEFVREAGRLAIIGVSDIKTSVNALTSVMNAYGRSTFETASISAVLFKSVELGRTRLSELEQNFGRLNILSSKLGVSLEEQQAAMTTLTVQGLKENVSKTLLVNVYNKLIRPSKRMKEIFDEIGVASGESAIKTFGLGGTLNILFEKVRQSGRGLEELGEIFKRIRATIGAMGLDTEKYAENLKELSNATSDYKQKVAEIQETLGVSIQRELSRVNALMIRVGTGFLEFINSITGSVGGMEAALKAVTRVFFDVSVALAVGFNLKRIQAFGLGIGAVAKAMWKFNIRTTAANFSVVTLRTSMKALLITAWPFIAVSAAVAVADMIYQAGLWRENVRENIEKVRKAYQKLNEGVIAQTNENLVKWTKEMKKGLEEIFQPLRAVNVELNKMQDALSIDLEASFEELGDIVKEFGQTVTDALALNISNLGSQIRDIVAQLRDAERALAKAQTDREDAEKALSDRQFARGQIGLNLAEQAKRIEDRATSKDRPAEGAIKDYEEILKLADKFGSKLKAQATRDVATIIQERNNQIKALNATLGKGVKKIPSVSITSEERDTLVGRRLKELERTTNLDEERRRINDEITKLMEGQVTAAKDAAKAAQDAIDTGKVKEDTIREEERIKKDAKRDFGRAITGLTGFDITDETKKLEKSLKIEDKKNKIFAIRDSLLKQLDTLTRKLNDTAVAGGAKDEDRISILRELQKRRIQIQEDTDNKLLGLTQNNLTQQRTEIEEDLQQGIKNRAEAEAKKRDIVSESEKTIVEEVERLRSNALTIFTRGSINDIETNTRELVDSLKEVKIITDDLAVARARQNPSEQAINDLFVKREELLQEIIDKTTGLGTGVDKAGLDLGDVTVGKSTNDILKALQDQRDASKVLGKTVGELGNIKDAIAILNDELRRQQLDLIKVDSPINENSKTLRELTAEMIENIRETAKLKETLEKYGRARNLDGFAQGGQVRGPSGVDKVPAWLTAGEYVVNAAAARENLPLLQALNSSRIPKMSKGGTVSNYKFGNINVTGGSTSKQTARSIARELRREMGRGTLTL